MGWAQQALGSLHLKLVNPREIHELRDQAVTLPMVGMTPDNRTICHRGGGHDGREPCARAIHCPLEMPHFTLCVSFIQNCDFKWFYKRFQGLVHRMRSAQVGINGHQEEVSWPAQWSPPAWRLLAHMRSPCSGEPGPGPWRGSRLQFL